MKHHHEQSSRSTAGRNLPPGGLEFVEPAEDHHKNDEAPEDHSRREEPNSLSPTSGRILFQRRRGSPKPGLGMTSCPTISHGLSPSRPPLHPLLLCIDDDEAVLEMLFRVLEKHGYNSLSASSGRLGIQAFKENVVDLVILDHNMPGLDGRETAEELRHLDSRVPIIMSSGTPDISARVGRLVDAYVPKGIEYSFLLSAIANLLQLTKTRQEQSGPRH
jgi:CheY-like chemotaxis protein